MKQNSKGVWHDEDGEFDPSQGHIGGILNNTDWREEFDKALMTMDGNIIRKCVQELIDKAYLNGKRDGRSVASFNSEIDKIKKEAYEQGKKDERTRILGSFAIDDDIIPDQVYVMSRKNYERLKEKNVQKM